MINRLGDKMKKVQLITNLIILTIFFTSSSFCKDYYINAVKGSNNYSGTLPEDAWKTINHTLSQVDGTPDDPAEIYIFNGIYDIELGESFPIYPGNNISLIGEDMDNTIIDASGSSSSVFILLEVVNIFFENLTITGGEVMDDMGGGFYIWDSVGSITRCKITGNSAYYGGGLFSHSINYLLTDSIISDNYAYSGGGIYSGELQIKNCIIENNSGEGYLYDGYVLEGEGGGLYCYFSPFCSIVSSTIRNNEAYYGGGIYSSEAGIVLRDCLIENNSAKYWGGGIQFDNTYENPLIEDCNIINNQANIGSGIYLEESSPAIDNCLIKGNNCIKSDEYEYNIGGGLYCLSSDPNVTNSIISDNIAEWGGGLYLVDASPYIASCIIEKNTAESDEYDYSSGGGIYCQSWSHPELINILIAGNTSVYCSSIVCNDKSSVRLKYATIADNSTCSYGSIYADTDCEINILNSIVWNNGELTTGGNVKLSYTDIDSDNYIGTGLFNDDPLFISGPRGDYYLSQIAAGQDRDSPCIDIISKVNFLRFNPHGTTSRTDGVMDANNIDLGYHYNPLVQFELKRAPNKLKFKSGDSFDILLDLDTSPDLVAATLYLVMIDTESNIFSGLGCVKGLSPMADNVNFVPDLKIRDQLLWSINVPCETPPVSKEGIYTIYMCAVVQGTADFLSNLGKISFEIY